MKKRDRKALKAQEMNCFFFFVFSSESASGFRWMRSLSNALSRMTNNVRVFPYKQPTNNSL